MATCSSGKCCGSQQEALTIPDVDPLPTGKARRYKLSIRGMHCGSCAAKLEKALQAVQGVRQVRVAFATERLLIDVDDAQIRNTVTDVVREMGYRLENAGKIEEDKPFWHSHFTFILLSCLSVSATILHYAIPAIDDAVIYFATAVGIVPFAKKAISQIKNGTWFGIETLMTVAALGALVLGETTEALLVLLLFSLGEMLEGFAGHKAKAGIKSLMQLTPDIAIKVQGHERLEVPSDFLNQGELIEVRPGDRLPVDGSVYSRHGLFNESALTGESMPILREQGEMVMAGSVVVDQPVQLVVTSEPGRNAIDRIVTLIEEAEGNRAPIARMIDTFSARYTPLVMGIAALVMIVPPLLMGAAIQPWAYKALTLLLIACPCALVISIPAAVTSALVSASHFGALIKGGAALEQLRMIKTLAFDKTGTLTEGKPKVTALVPLSASEDTLLQLTSAIEQGSNHPLAKAIISEAKSRRVALSEATNIQVFTGQGIQGDVDGKTIRAIAPRYVQEGLITHDILHKIEGLEKKGNTVVVVLINNDVLGLIGLADTLRNDAVEAIEQLRGIGIESIMLTGDNRHTAAAIAGKLGVAYQSELLPEDKVKAIQLLQSNSEGAVAMVGDGINDAPALKTAELGIAMGCGSDVALETADAALTHERLTELVTMIRLSKNTAKITRQNIVLALGINTLFLLTTICGLTGLMGAVLSDAGGSVLITLNALRLMQVSAHRQGEGFIEPPVR